MLGFRLSEEQESFRLAVRSFAEKELAPRVDELEAAESFPMDLFRHLGSLGYLGVGYPEEYGGSGGDMVMRCLLIEELARVNCGFAAALLAHVGLGCIPIFRFGTEEQKRRYLVPAIKGEKLGSFGLSEPNSGSDAASIRTTAERHGDHYVINGTKMFITNGNIADYCLVAAYTDRTRRGTGISMFIVDTDTPGFIREKKLEKLGMHASDTALLAFQDMRVPGDAVLGEVGKGFYHIMWELQGERLIGAAGCVAGAQRCFDMTLQYAKERTAFGRPIGGFQVIRHKFAEMATKIETARQMVYTTAWRVQNGDYPVREISMAKLYASRIAFEVADECLQIHGGNGYMKEYGIERAWRDVRLNRIGAGTDEIMLEVIGRSYGL